MGNWKEQAYELYEKLLHAKKDNIGNNNLDYMQTILDMKNTISCMVDEHLQSCRPEEKFRLKEFPNIIYLSLKDESSHPQKTAEAFENLENCIVLIYLMPWKKEFHIINKYCGFYQAKVHAHMRNVDSVFKLIGYTEVEAGTLVQTMKPDPELLKCVAFECLVASVECQIIYRISKRTLGYNISFNEIVRISLTQTGTEDQLVSCVQSKLNQGKIQGGLESQIDNQNTNGVKNYTKLVTISTDPFRNKLQNYMEQAEKLQIPDMDHDIPFMDEESKVADYTAGCLDEHILASLKLVEEISDPSTSNDNMELKPSQEWSFVREGITKKYGEKYYEGFRKDILVHEKMDIPEPHEKQNSDYIQLMGHGAKCVNVDNNLVLNPEHIMQYDALTGTIGSQNSSGSPFVNLPMSYVNKLRARGIMAKSKQTTDILAKKQLLPVPLGTGKTSFSQSAPLAKRHVEKQDNKPMSSFPIQWTYSNIKKSDEINTYKNHASAPMLEPDKVLDSGIVCYSTSSSSVLPKATMTESYNQTLNRNVFDNSDIPKVVSKVQTSFTTSNLSSKSANKLEAQYSKSLPLQWPCPFCTFLNSTSGNICGVCSKSRENIEINTKFVGPCSRICHKCTLENENNTDTCNVCGNLLGATHTVV